MSDDQGRTDEPEPGPGEPAETGSDAPTSDPDAPGVGALDEGDGSDDADPRDLPEPNEPA
jgi:hypothetical protein